jgi:hypothetical protein
MYFFIYQLGIFFILANILIIMIIIIFKIKFLLQKISLFINKQNFYKNTYI